MQTPPFPVTLSPPLTPVEVKTIPLDGKVLLPVTLMLLKVSPLALMVLLTTLSAAPVVDARVLTIVVLS